MKKLFQDLKTQIVHDYQTIPMVLLAETIGTLASILASTTLSLLGKEANLVFVLSFYLIGCVGCLIAARKRNNSMMFLLAFSYTIINLIGLAKLLF